VLNDNLPLEVCRKHLALFSESFRSTCLPSPDILVYHLCILRTYGTTSISTGGHSVKMDVLVPIIRAILYLTMDRLMLVLNALSINT
jgi:hypothetical protein